MTFSAFDVRASSYEEQLISSAIEQGLYQARQWRKLLLIPDHWHGGAQSVVDEPSFFLAVDGKSSPAAELKATIKGFFRPQAEDDPNSHPQCRHPARLHWLDAMLAFDWAKLKKVECPELANYERYLDYEAVSLVFSNYYINNPASMFGHTFLRMHRRQPQGSTTNHEMLDDIVNFSAFVQDTSSILYPIRGLAGYFPGRFSLLPYYRKIQEYSNFESRDLWEYKLRLSDDHLKTLKYLLWEVGFVHIDYYYLDENCSFILLLMLEAANPELALTGNFNLYAIPADTLRAVVLSDGMLDEISYRPSSLARYLFRFNALSDDERKVFMQSITSHTLIAFEGGRCDTDCERRVLDAVLEFIDFEERLAGQAEATQYAKLRRQALSRRAQVGGQSSSFGGEPLSSPPHLGHSSSRIGLQLALPMKSKDEAAWELHWRPALHDRMSKDLGYSPEMQIAFLESHFRYWSARSLLTVEKVHLLTITSLPKSIPMVRRRAWQLDLGYDQIAKTRRDAVRGRYFARFGLGNAKYSEGDRWMVYGLLHVDVSAVTKTSRPSYFAPVAELGGHISFASAKLFLKAWYGRWYGASAHFDHHLLQAGAAYYPGHRNLEFQLLFEDQAHGPELKINALRYF